ncbi:MAG: PP2C family protein-serine/threonine phosphatase [Betaproteobacteria bacterium]
MNFELASDTRIGARRVNQDRLGYWQTGEALFLALADGMGGHLRGEVAAQRSMEVLADEFRRAARPRIAEPETFLGTALHAAHAAILVEGRRMRLPESPRTVVVACLVQDGAASWTHVGDCRLYLIRDSRVVRRTRDHSVVQQLIDQGRIREEAIESHPERNRLLQCLGGLLAPRPEPAQRETLAPGDVLLLCSDGFWGALAPRQLLHSIATRPLREAIDELAALAERRAGERCDNVSVLAVRTTAAP